MVRTARELMKVNFHLSTLTCNYFIVVVVQNEIYSGKPNPKQ